MEPETCFFRRMERDCLAGKRARERRSRMLRPLVKAALFVALTAAAAVVTHGLFLAPHSSAENLLGAPKRLLSAVLTVNAAPEMVPVERPLSPGGDIAMIL